ncbi:hypothetical protein WJX74_007583 [Apatococcus lobatus]|uniref:Uncharacterized protein n=1 Tax=Apatococcus lobatus TaxID=904363 RepID=A0AAW1SH66_9CHLO
MGCRCLLTILTAGLFLLPPASTAVHSELEETYPRRSEFAGANALRDWTALMNPHAKVQRQNLLEQAEKRRKSRHLLQDFPSPLRIVGYPSPPPPSNLRLDDGSTCCPTKPVLSNYDVPEDTPTPVLIPPADGLLTFPTYINAMCEIHMVGNNRTGLGGIVSASIKCQTQDGTDVLIYMGGSLLAKSFNFTGVYAVPPQPNTIDLDANALFFVQSGSIMIYNSSFTNIAISQDFPLITITEGTSPTLILDSTFTNITTCVDPYRTTNMCLPVVASTQQSTYIQIVGCNFFNNACFNQTVCHTGSVYITNRSQSVIRDTVIRNSTGHFGSALMVTDGASVKAYNSVFLNNRVDVFGSFGAIWLSACQAFDPFFAEVTGFGYFDNIAVGGNFVNGIGAGLAISTCDNTIIRNSIFYNNSAYLVGGGIGVQNSNNTQITGSYFIQNTAQNFFGGAMSLEPCSSTYSINSSVFVLNNEQVSFGTSGCSASQVGNYVASYLPNDLLVNVTNTLANLPESGLPTFK